MPAKCGIMHGDVWGVNTPEVKRSVSLLQQCWHQCQLFRGLCCMEAFVLKLLQACALNRKFGTGTKFAVLCRQTRFGYEAQAWSDPTLTVRLHPGRCTAVGCITLLHASED